MNAIVFVCLIIFGFGCTNASDVLVFTDSDFQTKVKQYDVILVEFYAPWCGHCKKLAPEYEKAATKLKSEGISIAKVDCTVETETCQKYGVSGYPTLKIFRNGDFSKDYPGPREAGGIVSTMKKESGPISKVLETVEAVQEFLAKDSHAAIGYFDDVSGKLGASFMKVADQVSDVRFGHCTSEKVRKEMKQTKDGVVLYKPKILQNKFEDSETKSTETSSVKIKEFVQKGALGLCGIRTMDNAENIEKPYVVVYYNVDYSRNPKGTNYWRNRVMKVAKKVKEGGRIINFAVSNIDEMGRELDECGIEDRSGDKPFVCARDSKDQKFKMTTEFSVENFEKFVEDFLSNKLEAYLKSEPVPSPNDDPVKVVVAKNFDEIVNNEEKDVLIEFYAPWCGHCKSLAPKYEELAEKLKDEDSITIAKMDATANDVPSPYNVQGFPTIYYAPKNSKSSPRKYEGGREVSDFIKYLAKESTDGLSGYNKDGKKKKKKADKKEL